jgi:hypothetical protein
LGTLAEGEVYQAIGRGELRPQDQVWRKGMAGWEPASSYFTFPQVPLAAAPAKPVATPKPLPAPITPAESEPGEKFIQEIELVEDDFLPARSSLSPPFDEEDEPAEPRYGVDNLKIIIVFSTVVLGGLSLMFFISALITIIKEETTKGVVVLGLGVFIAAVAGGLGGVIHSGSTNSCPECRRWWAQTFQRRKLIDKKLAYKTVSRHDLHFGSYSGSSTHGGSHSGSTWGTTSRREQVKVLRRIFDDHYKCKYCRHRWVLTVFEDSENFELDELDS